MSGKEPKEDNHPMYETCKEACRKFFDSKRLKDLYDELEVKHNEVQYETRLNGEVYDISGLSALQVIAVMTAIINGPGKWIRDKIFYFLVKTQKSKKSSEDKIFKLKALPRPNQPGNGFFSVLSGEKKPYVDNRGKTHVEMNEELAQTPPGTFAEVIQKLFKDNSEIGQEDSVIAEEYFLLLFEIARRLSNKEGKNRKVRALDELPIGSAIAIKFKTLAVKDLQKDLDDLALCFKNLSLSRKSATIQVIKNHAAETLSSCVKELEETFCGSSLADLNFKLALRGDLSPLKYLIKEERSYYKGSPKYLKKSFTNIFEETWSSEKKSEKIFKTDAGQISCKYDKTEKQWDLNFTDHAAKETFTKLANNDSHQDFVAVRRLCWKGKFKDLKKFVSEFMMLEGTWDGKMFESYGVKINCKYNEKKEHFELIFDGDDGRKEEENVIELLQWQLLATELRGRYQIHDVNGDGACFFRAVSHQIYGQEDQHHDIRMAGISHIQESRENYVAFMAGEESVDDYIERMSEDALWCDHIIMQAVADKKNLIIRVIQPNGPDVVLGSRDGNAREIVVGYINRNHYVSLVRIDQTEKEVNEKPKKHKKPKKPEKKK